MSETYKRVIMNNIQTISQKVAEKFKTPDGQIVDVIYATSDDKLYFSPSEAQKEANKLTDKIVTAYYKDPTVRELAKQYIELRKMVVVTDYLKLAKLEQKTVTYADYLKYCDEKGFGNVPIDVYNFVRSKVFTLRRLIVPGQKDTIYTYKGGIVEAYFQRREPNGIIWMLGPDIVFTCPTHTELARVSYYELFYQFMGEDPRKETKTTT